MIELWWALVVLVVFHMGMWIFIGVLLRKVGRLEDRCEALTDPDEYENMIADLHAHRRFGALVIDEFKRPAA